MCVCACVVACLADAVRAFTLFMAEFLTKQASTHPRNPGTSTESYQDWCCATPPYETQQSSQEQPDCAHTFIIHTCRRTQDVRRTADLRLTAGVSPTFQ